MPRDWQSWLDQQIREAQERGDFDDLPGKGQPLDLTPNPYARDREMAFKILKDAGYAPEWIELDKAIRSRLQKARATLARSWEFHGARLRELADGSDSGSEAEREQVRAGWQRAVAAFGQEVADINHDIADLNLKVPGSRFQRPKIDVTREVARLEGIDLNEGGNDAQAHDRMAETVRLVVTRRERAPRSPRMERALKRLIWRYARVREHTEGNTNDQE
jgi:hypothetical protein